MNAALIVMCPVAPVACCNRSQHMRQSVRASRAGPCKKHLVSLAESLYSGKTTAHRVPGHLATWPQLEETQRATTHPHGPPVFAPRLRDQKRRPPPPIDVSAGRT